MSALNQLSDRIRGEVFRGIDIVRAKIFGANNERLDFIIDSFYKLSPRQQTVAISGLAVSFLILVFGTFMLYLTRVGALDENLNSSYQALRDLRTLSESHAYEDKRFNELKAMVSRASSGFKPKPFFEAMANRIGVTITDLRSSETEVDPSSPLSRDFRNVVIDFKMPKVSVPRLIRFLSEIEKSDKFINVSNLEIRSRFGERLYFEVSAKVVGFLPRG